MIDIPVYNLKGEQTGSVSVDEAKLGGEVRPQLLKQAFVRTHANKRPQNSPTKSRSDVRGSTRKLYKQKGTGNARRGDKKANILRGGGRAFAKTKHSWSQDMPKKMRRLANRNALLAKLVDGEVKLLEEGVGGDKPSTKAFAAVLDALKIDRSCLVALADVQGADAKSARNLDSVSVTQIDRLCVFDVLNHRYLLAGKADFEAYLEKFVNNAPAHTAKEAA
ncbi:MAG: 50S ribosomal protein L4 [Planctomycetota bacterium]